MITGIDGDWPLGSNALATPLRPSQASIASSSLLHGVGSIEKRMDAGPLNRTPSSYVACYN